MKLVIIDYGSGNLRSVENAFRKSITDNKFRINIEVTNELASIKKGDFIVLPGVGSFPDCKRGLEEINGLIETLSNEILFKQKPFLGICVGMQLMVEYSLEKTKTNGFGWLTGYLKKINSEIIENYEVINLHPSLLPKYKGLMTQKRMLINKEVKYGYTIHKVTKYLDDGDILNQNQRNISTYNEDELSLNHKKLEHKCVFKDLVNFLN